MDEAGLSQTLEMAAKVVGSDQTFRRERSLKTVPIRPFLGLLTNFATGPKSVGVQTVASVPDGYESAARGQRKICSH